MDDNPENTLMLDGEMTIYNAMEQKQKILAALDQDGPLLVDLGRVGYMDTAGLQLLILLNREAAIHNKKISILNCGREILDLLDFCNLRSLVSAEVGNG